MPRPTRSPLVNEDAGPAHLQGRTAIHLSEEATERNRSVRALRASELRYRRVFEAAPFGILVLDGETGVVTDVNRYVRDMLGYTAAELVGRPLWSAAAFRNAAESKHRFRDLLYERTVRYDDLPLETQGGDVKHVEFLTTLYLVDGRPFVQCTIRDVTERVRAERGEREAQEDLEATITALRETDPATHDRLTGLLTSCHLEASLTRELHRARRERVRLAVAILEVDGFARFVAAHGRGAGDAVLRESGRVLREHLRRSDLACRYGAGSGAEFGLVLPESSTDATLQRLEEIRAAVQGLELRHDGRPLDRVTLSAGTASAAAETTADALLAAARAALVAARREGGDRVVAQRPNRSEPHA